MRIGTDCSGMDAPLEALRQLNKKVEYVFGCDSWKVSKQFIHQNGIKPKVWFDDMTTRNDKLLPDIDMYICGFPCQSFSNLGQKRGMADVEKGNVMLKCISVIKTKLPKVFILENVKGFIGNKKGEAFGILMKKLKNLNKYELHYSILNTIDYDIPQNRERFYLVGILKTELIAPFTFPKKIKPTKHISEFIDDVFLGIKPSNNIIKNMPNWKSTDFCIATETGFGNFMKDKSPTITRGRLYISKYQRYLTPMDLLRLQGFKEVDFSGIAITNQKKIIGNTMSVNVLKELFKSIFKSVKIN